MIKRGVYAAGLSVLEGDMSLDVDSTIKHSEKIVKEGKKHKLCHAGVHAMDILRMEKEGIMSLMKTEETMERIEHMLSTGKPLRN